MHESFDSLGIVRSLQVFVLPIYYRSFYRLLKKAFSKAAGSANCEAYLLKYVERFARLRTKLGVFFSSRLVVHLDFEA